MADIKWISATAANFSTASAWQGGIVPGAGDTAIFDVGGAGNCTIDAPVAVGGLKILADYGGTFAQSGKTMTLGQNGVGALILLKVLPSDSFDAPIDFYGDDIFLATAVNAVGTQLTVNTSCDFRVYWSTTNSNSYFRAMVVMNGAVVTFHASRHPDYPGQSVHSTYQHWSGSFTNNGMIDISEMRSYEGDSPGATNFAFQFNYGSSLPVYNGANGTIRNNDSGTKWILGGVSTFAMGNIIGNVALEGRSYNTNLTGDFRSLKYLRLAKNGTGTLNLTGAFYREFVFEQTGGTPTVLDNKQQDITGDISITRTAGDGPVVLSGLDFRLTGTSDQTLDLLNSTGTVSLSAQKAAGDAMISSGNFTLAEDSDFGGKLTFAAGYSGTFATNGYDVAFGGIDMVQTVGGTIDFGVSTVHNRGGFDGRGIVASLLKTDACHWIQDGGDRTANLSDTWQDATSRTRVFASLTFTENSNTTLASVLALRTRVMVNGKITVSSLVLISGADNGIVVGEHADIPGTSYIHIVDCSGTGGISGHTENIATKYINIRGATGHVSGTYNIPVRLENYSGNNVEISVTNATFNGLLRLPIESTDENATLTIRLNATNIAGDLITTKKFDSQTITIDGIITASGENDQTFELSDVTDAIEISSAKPSGDVLLSGGSFALSDDFTIADDTGPTGSLTITGTASLDGNEYTVTVDDFDSSQTTATVSLALLKVSGNIIMGTSTLVQKCSMIGMKNQTVDFRGTSDFPLFHWDKQTGSCIANCPVVLFAGSRIGEFSLDNMPEGFSLNNQTLNVLGDRLHLLDAAPAKYLFPGELIFSGSDFVLRDTALPESSTLTFTSATEARLISTTDTPQLLGNLNILENGCVTLSQTRHATIAGTPANVLFIAGDLNIVGQLSYFQDGLFSIIMIGEEKLFQFGKISAASRSEIAFHPGGNFIRPIQAEIEGNVSLRWDEPCEIVNFLPGDYRCLKTVEIPGYVETVGFGAGRYDFDELLIHPHVDHVISLISDHESPVEGFGKIRVIGTGTVNCEMERFHWETLVLEDATFGFSSDEIRIDQPWVTRGTICGEGTLTVTGRQPFHLDAGAIDVGVLCIVDGDGSIAIAQQGYESLTLKADAKDSLVILNGKYQMKNLLLTADNAVLSVDLRNSPRLVCSGHVATQTSGHGTVRLCGNGTDVWEFNGNENQTVDMQLEQGFHTLGTVINAKTGGSLTASKPITTVYYRKPDGTRLAAIANMTLVSDVFIKGSLYLLTGDSRVHQAEEGLRLRDVKTTAGNRAIFFAALHDRDGEPIAPALIEKIALSVLEMNPVAPYLHAPRKIWISHEELDLDKVLTPVLQEDTLLPEDVTYNFRYDNVLFDAFPCNHPGLYYVVFEISLYGIRSPIPFRYEILCERP